MSKAERRKRTEELLERVSMLEFGDVPLQQYSKGMLQRVGLCQTLLHNPKIIILDEPMSGLDPLGRALVRDIIVEENKKGTTVFFSSHVLSDVKAICTRVAILVKGKLRNVGPIEELIGNQVKSVECLFEGPNDGVDFEAQILTRTATQTWISCSVEEQEHMIQKHFNAIFYLQKYVQYNFLWKSISYKKSRRVLNRRSSLETIGRE